MTYEYDWETCIINEREWQDMLRRRKEWRMVSASVMQGIVNPQIVAYVFWEREVDRGKRP